MTTEEEKEWSEIVSIVGKITGLDIFEDGKRPSNRIVFTAIALVLANMIRNQDNEIKEASLNMIKELALDFSGVVERV